MNAPGTFMDANAIPNSQKIMALATNHNGSCVGGIVQIDQNFGPNAQEGVLNTTPEVDVFRAGWQWGNGLSGPYEKPFALDENTYLVTKSGDVQVRTTDGSSATLLAKNKETGNGYYSVQPVREYPVPPVVKSGTANDSLALPEDGRVSGNWAVVTMQDVYNGLEPTVKRGEVKRIAVIQEIEKPSHSPYEFPKENTPYKNHPLLEKMPRVSAGAFGYQFPVVSCGATYAPKKVWGFADVAPDGSSTFKVPSEVPIYFMALDAEGRAVQRMRTFTHLMPGEVQGCIGCHVDRNTQTPKSSRMTAKTQIQELQPPSWGVKGFAYQEIVQPVLDKHCVSCHNAKQKDGNLDLSGDYTDFFNVSYDQLARKGTLGERNWLVHNIRRDSRDEGVSPYTNWIWTINGAEWNILEVTPKRWGSPVSLLADLLRNGHPDSGGKKRIDVPQAEREKVYLWIDLNVPYYPTSASNHKNQIGSRRMYPADLDAVLHDVSARRCAECHLPNPQQELGFSGEPGDPLCNVPVPKGTLPREFYTRFMKPENNAFLLAPLAKAAGGTQRCGKVVFETKDDPDYQKILDTFKPVQQLVKERPREDMPEYVEPPCKNE
jgi:mono/diheme cytochrome c family protein